MTTVNRVFGHSRLSRLEHALLGFGTGALLVYFLIWAVGSVAYTAASMWIVYALWCLLGLVSLHKLRAAETAQGLRQGLALPETAAARFWCVVLGGLIVNALLAGLAPPADFDGLNYHLTIPRRDLELGHITAVVNDRTMEAFPALMEMLYRLALATAGDRAAQMIHGAFGIAAALGAACLVLRLGGHKSAAVLAAVMFLGIRSVLWEAGTTHNELALAAYCGLTLLAYLNWRDNPGLGSMVLFGLMAGAMSNVKYQGLMLAAVFGPLLIYDLLARRQPLKYVAAGVTVAALVFMPHAVRNAVVFGNPVAPMFAGLFPASDPVMHIPFDYKVGGFWDTAVNFVRSPWDIFIFGGAKFDGQQFGAPYLLVFAPLAALTWRRLQQPWPALVVGVAFFVIWYFLLFRQVRFLIPVFPILAAFGAIGAAAFWEQLKSGMVTRAAAVAVAAVLVANQLMFVGAYSALRLPPAVGLISKEAYLSAAPTIGANMFASCQFVSKTLGSGERYLSFLNSPRSYYCPQRPAIYDMFDDERTVWARRPKPHPEPTPAEMARRIETEAIRLVIVPNHSFSAGAPGRDTKINEFNLTDYRFGTAVAAALEGLQPIFKGRDASVFDATDVRIRLLETRGSSGKSD